MKRKPCKEGYKIALELSKVDLSKFECTHRCYACVFWTSFCNASIVKNLIQKSQDYINLHIE